VVLALLAVHRLGSGAVAGALVAALLVPHVVAAPVVGALVDRVRRPGIVICLAAVLFGSGLAVVVTGLGRVPLPVLLGMLAVSGCAGPALTGGLTSRLPDLVPEEQLTRAFGADVLVYNVAAVVGPAAAATVSGLASPTEAGLVLAVAAMVGGLVLLGLPASGRRPEAAPAHLTLGARAIVGDRLLAVVTFASALAQVGTGALPVVAAVLASRAGQPAAGGWLLTAAAAGGVLGSALWTARPVLEHRTELVALAGSAAIGVPIAVAALILAITSGPGLPLLALAGLFAVSGFFAGPSAGAVMTIRQRQAPDGARAQVFAMAAGIKITSSAAGAALAGALASLAAAVQLGAVAAFPLLAAGLGAVLIPSTRSGRR
jgi:hypothetical protein